MLNNLPAPIEIFILLSLLSFLPGALVMVTSFTRIVVVLSLLRQAIGTQNVPPNQIIIGLSFFLTLFLMSPTLEKIHNVSYVPYKQKQIGLEDALKNASYPLKDFMIKHVREKDLALFLKLSNSKRPATFKDIPLKVLVPAFAIGELKKAFEIGFLIYMPFLVIDMVVSSILLSMGMMMLPPIMISLPFKLLLFVMVDGWHLIITSMVGSFS